MSDISSGVADLQSRWHTLCDLDRARAIQSMYQSGIRLRELAPLLNCSTSLLSNLLRAAEAPAEDRELARHGDISTRELVRRAGASGTRSTHMQREARALDYEREVMKASQAIMRWFNEENVPSTDREQVIDNACLRLSNVDKLDLGLLEADLPDIPLDAVIRLFRPALFGVDGDRSIACHAEWLAQWTLHGILDDGIRIRAIELARTGLDAHMPELSR